MHNKKRKKGYLLLTLSLLAVSVTACSSSKNKTNSEMTITTAPTQSGDSSTTVKDDQKQDTTMISLSNDKILVDGEAASTKKSAAVYTGESIIYYEEGKDSSYGAGSDADAHSKEDADAHTVITITKPGIYEVSGKLDAGQIYVDLGKNSKEDKNAKVTLILNNAEITCSVAPAIVVNKAYECGSKETETATKDVDTSDAGFQLIIADDSTNVLNGSYVAKIYEEGTTDKKYKYDGALESKVSFNIDGQTKKNGTLTVNAAREGIESGLHLTINGGNLIINAADDAINANEDNVSVITINGGVITCDSGLGKEGDGIDSNGFLVINGGYLIASANASSPDSGLDSELGTYINGGTVLASGNMYDAISSDSTQNFMVLSFNQKESESDILMLKNAENQPLTAFQAVNDYSLLVYSSPNLAEGDYTLYDVSAVTGETNGSIYTNITDFKDAVQMQYTSNTAGGRGGMGMGGGKRPFGDGTIPQMPDGTIPQMPDGTAPQMPNDATNGTMPQAPDGTMPQMPNGTAPDGATDSKDTDGNSGASQKVDGTSGATQKADGESGTFSKGDRFNGGKDMMQRPGDSTTSTMEPSTTFTLSKESYMFGGITKVSQ